MKSNPLILKKVVKILSFYLMNPNHNLFEKKSSFTGLPFSFSGINVK